MPNWKLTIEYEGTRYSGWQVQSNTKKTVQGKLLDAARDVIGEVQLQGAGRTDAGVHAAGQVASLRAKKAMRADDLAWEINQRLPADIHLVRAEEVPERFHARHDALERIYLYQISTRRTAFAKPFVWWVRDRIDPAAIERASQALVGMHDFSRWTDRRNESEEARVKVERIGVGLDGDLVLIRIGASHFLWKMVRKLVAALVDVGRGQLTAAQFESLLREPGPYYEPTAPPAGLFLEAVLYPGEAFDRPLQAIVPVGGGRSEERGAASRPSTLSAPTGSRSPRRSGAR
jgi:tRNA pseudouridine38-40 synthase